MFFGPFGSALYGIHTKGATRRGKSCLLSNNVLNVAPSTKQATSIRRSTSRSKPQQAQEKMRHIIIIFGSLFFRSELCLTHVKT